MGASRQTVLLCPSPHLPKRPFQLQNDKHSDLTAKCRITVMAVAADFHCDFLIPERKAPDYGFPR